MCAQLTYICDVKKRCLIVDCIRNDSTVCVTVFRSFPGGGRRERAEEGILRNSYMASRWHCVLDIGGADGDEMIS